MTVHKVKSAKVYLGDKEIAILGDLSAELVPLDDAAAGGRGALDSMATRFSIDVPVIPSGDHAVQFWRDVMRGYKESRYVTARALDADVRDGDPRRRLADKESTLIALRQQHRDLRAIVAHCAEKRWPLPSSAHGLVRHMRMAIRRTERKIAKLRVALAPREFRDATERPMPHDDRVDALAYAIDVSSRDQSLEYKSNVIRESPGAEVRAARALPEERP